MKLSLRQKQNFYYELGQLLRSGASFAKAAETLSYETSGSLRRFITKLAAAATRGETVAGALAAQQPPVSEMEVSIISACERSGRLDQGCAHLSKYFGTLEQSRAVILKRLAYPAFILHFGIFILALPKLVIGGSVADYLKQTLGVLAVLYFVVAAALLAGKELARIARTSALADRLLRAIPGLGKVRVAFSLARFCATYEAQLQAAVNVMESLATAGRASQSALVSKAVQATLPEVRSGAQVAPLLARSSAFPKEMIRALRLGEETGELDRELLRLAETFERQALGRVETLSEWLPKLIYVVIMLYLGYQIIALYQGILAGYGKMIEE